MRNKIHTIIIPERNKKDLDDIPPALRKKINFVYAKNMDEVLEVALLGGPPWTRKKSANKKSTAKKSRAGKTSKGASKKTAQSKKKTGGHKKSKVAAKRTGSTKARSEPRSRKKGSTKK